MNSRLQAKSKCTNNSSSFRWSFQKEAAEKKAALARKQQIAANLKALDEKAKKILRASTKPKVVKKEIDDGPLPASVVLKGKLLRDIKTMAKFFAK